MSFLFPAFLIGAVAIALPILLHLLRRDVAPEVPFTAVRLLRRSPLERAHKRRLRDLLLLAARIVAIVLLAIAFARPYLRGAAPAPLRIVAIDRSYSMGDRGRFARALALAREAIDDASSSERIAVLAFDDRAEIVAQPGGKAEARASLAALDSGFRATSYPVVFDKVLEIARGAAGRLVIVSDLQSSGWSRAAAAPSIPAGWEMDVRDAGIASANMSIDSVSVEPAAVIASVRNAGQSARSGRVRSVVDGREVAGTDFNAAPGQIAQVRIAWRAPASGALTVSLDDPDGLPADDDRYVVLGPRTMPKALVVTGGGDSGLFLSRALETSRTEDVDVVDGGRLASVTPEALSTYSMIAILSTRGLDRKTRELLATQVRAGTGLFVAAASDLDVSVLASMAEWQPPLSAVEQAHPVTLAATDVRHPIFRPFSALSANLGQVRFDRSWRVEADGWSVVARFSNGTPALLERSLGRGRVVLFASDVDRRWSDFPLHPAFVPFAIETARYVSDSASDRRRARDYTVANAPPGAGPGPGVFRTTDNRMVAVNVDPAEGVLDRLTTDAFAAKVERHDSGGRALEAQAHETESRQSFWQYGLALMLLALVAESFVGRS